MNERHKYEYKVDLNADTAAAKVVRMVGSEKRVLEIGAGPGSIAKLLREFGKCRVTAAELDERAIEKLKEIGIETIKCDLNDTDWATRVTKKGMYQVVVAADVLEHLYDPWNTLKEMKDVLQKDGYIVVSLPHIGHNAVIGCLLNADFEYQEWGLLDKTHIRFFSIKNIQHLFSQAGLKIIEAEFVVRETEQTEFSRYWRKLPEQLRRELNKNKFGTVYQVVIKAIPVSSPGKSLKLESLAVPTVGTNILSSMTFRLRAITYVKKMARSYLSIKMRTRISNFLIRAGMKL